jgi:hyperosmotically inducible periplasmic protein
MKKIMMGLLLASAVWAQSPDNTKTNERDRAKAAVTADQQKENKSDRQIAADIRRSITADKSLSSYARNVKIIARNGQVTLKGPVRTGEEKDAVAQKAAAVVGMDHVTNQVEVAPKKSHTDK